MQNKKTFKSQTSETKTPGNLPVTDDIRNEFGTAFLGMAGVASKIGYDVVKDYRASKEPFSVSVLTSKNLYKHHFVLFGLGNNTSHGLYVEKVLIYKPEKRDEMLSGIKVASSFVDSYNNIKISLDELNNLSIDSYKPTHIFPKDTKKLCIAIPELTPRTTHEKVPYLIATFIVSHLNAKKPDESKAEFRIRWETDQ